MDNESTDTEMLTNMKAVMVTTQNAQVNTNNGKGNESTEREMLTQIRVVTVTIQNVLVNINNFICMRQRKAESVRIIEGKESAKRSLAELLKTQEERHWTTNKMRDNLEMQKSWDNLRSNEGTWGGAAPSPTQDPHAHFATTPDTDPAARSGNKGAQPITRLALKHQTQRGKKHTTMVTAMPDTGASMCLVVRCVTMRIGITKHDLLQYLILYQIYCSIPDCRLWLIQCGRV